jgi:hypothetical protein
MSTWSRQSAWRAAPHGPIVVGSPVNPFGAERRLHDYVFAPPLSAPDLLSRLSRLGGQAQLLGREGSGKTTLLRTLARVARARGVTVLELRADRQPVDGAAATLLNAEHALLCVDEAAALSAAARRALWLACARAGISVLAASQRDIALPTLQRCSVDGDGAERVAAELLARCRSATALVAAREIRDVLRRGNMHAALAALYDLHEQRYEQRQAPARWT